MPQYQAKPLVVDAQQWNQLARVQGAIQDVKNLFGKALHGATPGAQPVAGAGAIVIDGDVHIVENNDWILTYSDGSKEILSNEQFGKKFELVPATAVPAPSVAPVAASPTLVTAAAPPAAPVAQSAPSVAPAAAPQPVVAAAPATLAPAAAATPASK